MSQNCKRTYTATRDANNNTLYHSAAAPGYGGRSFQPPAVATGGNYQQMTAKVLFGGVTAINDLKRTETDRETRRAH